MSAALPQIALAMTGASGAQVGIALLRRLVAQTECVGWVVSDNALEVIKHELGVELGIDSWQDGLLSLGWDAAELGRIRRYAVHDWFNPLASGSTAPQALIVSPCSMGTLGAIAQGVAQNLIQRCADVVLKERGKLVLMVRETPLSLIHIENMASVTRAGAIVMPVCPAFYANATTVAAMIDTLVERAIKLIGLPVSVQEPWYR